MRGIVQNEIRTLLELNNKGPHDNIVRMLNHGWLGNPHNYFYMDMELCDINLHEYIYLPRSLNFDVGLLSSMRTPTYVGENCSPLVRVRNILTIMTHISRGLEFLHRHNQVHRDLKPRNGLFLSFILNFLLIFKSCTPKSNPFGSLQTLACRRRRHLSYLEQR